MKLVEKTYVDPNGYFCTQQVWVKDESAATKMEISAPKAKPAAPKPKGLPKPKPAPTSLAAEMRTGLETFDGPVRILLAEADRTAQAFAENWGDDPRIASCPRAGHAYVEPHARQWLRDQVLGALRG